MEKSRDTRERPKRKRILLYVLGALYGAAVAVSIYVFILPQTQKRYESSQSYFFEELNRQIVMGLVKTPDDVADIQEFVSKKKNSPRLASASLRELLGQYLLVVTTFGKRTEDQRKEEAQLVKSLLNHIAEEKPFSILPEKEQFIAVELKKAIEDGQMDVARGRLAELTTSLGGKLNSATGEVKRNMMWAILSACAGVGGVALSVIFYLQKPKIRITGPVRIPTPQGKNREEEHHENKKSTKI
ncbi:hypothetical protein ES702_05698 [subsurface metagenome]